MKFEFSAGGIVIRREKRKIFVLVCQHSQHHGWVFPKGLIGKKTQISNLSPRGEAGKFPISKKETKEEAALREVKEETGIIGKIVHELSPVSYWYVLKGEKIKKTVYYYLMEHVAGNIHDHDDEMETVEWLQIHEVANRLTYKSDKEMWEKAKLLLSNPKSEYRNKPVQSTK